MVHLGGPYRQYKGKQRDPGCRVHSPALIHSHGHPQAHSLTVTHYYPWCHCSPYSALMQTRTECPLLPSIGKLMENTGLGGTRHFAAVRQESGVMRPLSCTRYCPSGMRQPCDSHTQSHADSRTVAHTFRDHKIPGHAGTPCDPGFACCPGIII